MLIVSLWHSWGDMKAIDAILTWGYTSDSDHYPAVFLILPPTTFVNKSGCRNAEIDLFCVLVIKITAHQTLRLLSLSSEGAWALDSIVNSFEFPGISNLLFFFPYLQEGWLVGCLAHDCQLAEYYLTVGPGVLVRWEFSDRTRCELQSQSPTKYSNSFRRLLQEEVLLLFKNY